MSKYPVASQKKQYSYNDTFFAEFSCPSFNKRYVIS